MSFGVETELSQRQAKRPARSLPESAFTLVELLVVIAVIGILISILLPAMTQAKEKANTIICQNNLRQLGIAFQMYLDDFEDAFPAANPIGSNTSADWIYFDNTIGFIGGRSPNESPIAKYLGGFQTNLFRCPSHSFLRILDTGSLAEPLKLANRFHFSYTLSADAHPILARGMASMIGISSTPILFKRSSIRSASEKIMLAEESTYEENLQTGRLGGSADGGWRWSYGRPDDDSITQRHHGRGHTVQADAHVELVKSNFWLNPMHTDPLK